MDYVNLHLRSRFKNKAKTKPIKANQSQSKPIKANSLDAQMNIRLAITRNYNNEQRTINNELLFKTNPIKPNLVRRPVRRSFSEDGSFSEGGCQFVANIKKFHFTSNNFYCIIYT
ncbi:hypothetical protein ES703_92208 [subsurface metagenome]